MKKFNNRTTVTYEEGTIVFETDGEVIQRH